MTMTSTGVKLIPAYAPPEDGKPRNAVDEKWMKLTNSARHYLSRRIYTRSQRAQDPDRSYAHASCRIREHSPA